MADRAVPTPASPKTGSLHYELPADVAPSSPYGIPLSFRRFYMSQYEPGVSSGVRAALGPHWGHLYPHCMRQWLVTCIVLVGCGTESDLRPGHATAIVMITPSVDSSADLSPFVVNDSGVNGGGSELEVVFIDPTGFRAFKFSLSGQQLRGDEIHAGATFDGRLGYVEGPGVDESWVTDLNAQSGSVTIEAADDAGFAFSIAPNQLIPFGSTATGSLVIEASGEAAYR